MGGDNRRIERTNTKQDKYKWDGRRKPDFNK